MAKRVRDNRKIETPDIPGIVYAGYKPITNIKKPIRWRRYKSFTPSLKPMAEGDAPAIFTQKLEYEDTVEITP